MTRPANETISRGKFLQICTKITLGLAGLLGMVGLVRYFSHRPQSGPPSTIELGPASDFPINGMLIRLDIPAVIYQTEAGFQGYSLICTHLGCTLEASGEGFSCPCHGSVFDPDGKVIKGPAGEDLAPLEVEITEEGTLLIHTEGGGL